MKTPALLLVGVLVALAPDGRAVHALEDESPVASLLRAADTRLEQGDLEEALEGYRGILAIKPDNVLARRGAGFALLELGRPEEAVPHLLEAIRLDPAAHRARENLGLSYAAIYDRITAELKRISLRPRAPSDEADPVWRRRMELNEKLKSFDYRAEALEAMREAARLAPDEPKYWYNLGTTIREYRRSDIAGATEALTKAVELDPSYYPALRNLVGALLDQGLFREARDLCLRIEARHGTDDAWLHLQLAGIASELGDLAEAERRLRNALATGADPAVVNLELAKVFQRRHEDELARRHLAEAIRLKPELERVFRQELESDR